MFRFTKTATQPLSLELIDARTAALSPRPARATVATSDAQLAEIRAFVAATPASVRRALTTFSIAKAAAGAADANTEFFSSRQPALV